MNHAPVSHYMFTVVPVREGYRVSGGDMIQLILPEPVNAQRSMDFFEQALDLELPWQFTLYQMEGRVEGFMPENLAPNSFLVRRVLDVPAQRFWTGRVEEIRRHGAQPPPPRPPQRPRGVLDWPVEDALRLEV